MQEASRDTRERHQEDRDIQMRLSSNTTSTTITRTIFFDREASGLATGVIVETQRSSGRVTPQTRGGNRHMDIPGNRPNEKANNDTDRAYDEGL